MLAWASKILLNPSTLKYVVILAVLGSAVGWVWHANNTMVKLSVDNKLLQDDLERANSSIKSIHNMASTQNQRILSLNKILRASRAELAEVSQTIAERGLMDKISEDPVKSAIYLPEEMRAILAELESTANVSM